MPITRRQFLKRSIATGVAGLAASYPFFIERYLVMVNHYKIPVPHLPIEFSGFRIVHLTDLHYGPLNPLCFIRHVINKTNSLKPDVTVCTGDYVLEFKSTSQIDTVWPELARLEARHGVYSVLGNHDHWANKKRSIFWLKKTKQDLRHKTVRIERAEKSLWLAGAGDLLDDHRSFDNLLKNIPDDHCRIVLAHNPDSADTLYSRRIDLMLSGHTHGGQVDIPFVGTPILPVRNKNYTKGLTRSLRGGNVFISRGIGWAKFPVRFNCPPEIAVLELVPDLMCNTWDVGKFV